MRSGVGRVRLMDTSRWRPPLGRRRLARVIAVGGASAGAGKSVVAANLAVAIAGLGPQVVLVDFDLAAPRLHDFFGIALPAREGPPTGGSKERIDTSLTSTGIRNLLLCPGLGAGEVARERRRDLIRQLYELDGDVVIVDVGTSNREDILDFFSVGAVRLLVSGPDRAALEATFAFLEGATRRAAARYGAEAARALERFRGRLIGNLTPALQGVETFHAFSRLVRQHLELSLPVLGCLRDSERITDSISAGRPLLAGRGLDENVRAFHGMAELLMMEGVISGDACDLGGAEPPVVQPRALPDDLRRYLRKHPRYPVDWVARLERPGGTADARVLDISHVGAAIEVFAPLATGDEALLRLHQLQGQPALHIQVRNVLPALHRVGVAFLEPCEISSRLVAAAAALAGSEEPDPG
jgi:flagellar biosynthesis protein FlhG